MKIVTDISKEMMMQISNKATKKEPAKYQFKIKIDNREYEAELLCHVIYDEEYRSFMTFNFNMRCI